MKDFSFFNSSPVYLEIGRDCLWAAQENSRVEIPLEREGDGKMTTATRARIASGLRVFVSKKTFQPRVRAYCAIAANGVSLRRLTLPATNQEKFEQVLQLQIEAEFPLAPDELAWGYQPLVTGTAGKQGVLVVAVKREVVEECRDLLAAIGLDPVFTLAALARNVLCPESNGTHALLDCGSQRWELVIFENGIPTVIRLLSVGVEASLPEAIAKAAGANWNGGKTYLSGANAEQVARLTRRFGGPNEGLPLPVEAGTTAAILGLKKSIEQGRGTNLLLLQNRVKRTTGRFDVSSPELKPWLKAAAILLGVLLILPFAEAVVLKPFLARKLAVLEAEKGRLAIIDHELEFLQSLKQSQPPYLDALFVFAKAAPPGTRFDSLNMDKRGEVSCHGTMQNSTQVTDFRAKLMASGFFSIVTVEEQAPTPDRQHVNLRMSALWKPVEGRAGLTIGPSVEEIQQAKTNRDSAAGGLPPGMMFP